MIAGVVLAAGQARRMGDALKQCLPCRGEALVHRSARVLLEAQLQPVVVVMGAGADQVGEAIADLPVETVFNPQWEAGQSTSVRAAIRALEAHAPAAAIVLPADQPFVPVTLIHHLQKIWRDTAAPIVTACIAGQPSTPVLLDAAVFPHLLTFTGDQGARALFGRFPPARAHWHDARARVEIDTPEDYRRWCFDGR